MPHQVLSKVVQIILANLPRGAKFERSNMLMRFLRLADGVHRATAGRSTADNSLAWLLLQLLGCWQAFQESRVRSRSNMASNAAVFHLSELNYCDSCDAYLIF